METIKGYIDHVIYRNDSNGYTVLNLVVCAEDVTCVGTFKTMDLGETIEATGEYISHPVYGEQFKVMEYVVTVPDDAKSMERYLASGAIHGVGEALAHRIVSRFGEDTYRIMEEEPERLAEVKGISEKKAREIAVQVYEKKDARDAFMFLQQYGISNTMSIRIYDKYGMGVYGILKENPYKLAEDISGIGFKIADEIANKAGIKVDSDYRIQSGILYELLQAAGEGHIYLPKTELLERASILLELPKEAIEPGIQNLAIDKKVIVKQLDEVEQIYSYQYYYAELNCAKMLHDLNLHEGVYADETSDDYGMLPCETNDIQRKIAALEKRLDIQLDELQKNAVEESAKNGIFILSGGPGTGKTTTINAMIQYFMAEGMDILLCAPTGRAAKRMSEATGYEAKTIHRLLEVGGGIMEEGHSTVFGRNESNPLEADVIIVDEMSMVDLFLFQSLLRAILVGTRLIMVGDVNQLPSVGPGCVLQDLMESERFPMVVLKTIFRQAKESDIIMNAHHIHAGEKILLDNKSKDFFFLERNDVNLIYKHMIQLITEKLPRYVDATPYDIQVLTPMRKGSLGVETLNEILQRYMNPESSGKLEYQATNTLFREGDKVMQIKNNYQLEWEIKGKYNIPIDKGVGIFNGDIGIIKQINEYAKTITVEFDEHRQVDYPYAQVDELELAYAVTIHKSQGSEYPAVVMPILSGPRMLFNRNLLYTAITRAKNCVTILGSSRTLDEMIANNYQNKRYTGLKQRVMELIS